MGQVLAHPNQRVHRGIGKDGVVDVQRMFLDRGAIFQSSSRESTKLIFLRALPRASLLLARSLRGASVVPLKPSTARIRGCSLAVLSRLPISRPSFELRRC